MEHVKLLILDVDGTLTDGDVHYDTNGIEHKHFHIHDGLGIVMGICAGLRFAVISGRRSVLVEKRMTELGVTDVYLGVGDKAATIRDLMTRYALQPAEVAYIGDDLNDLPAFDAAGVTIAVADADPLVRARADWVTPRGGGRGPCVTPSTTFLPVRAAPKSLSLPTLPASRPVLPARQWGSECLRCTFSTLTIFTITSLPRRRRMYRPHVRRSRTHCFWMQAMPCLLAISACVPAASQS